MIQIMQRLSLSILFHILLRLQRLLIFRYRSLLLVILRQMHYLFFQAQPL